MFESVLNAVSDILASSAALALEGDTEGQKVAIEAAEWAGKRVAVLSLQLTGRSGEYGGGGPSEMTLGVSVFTAGERDAYTRLDVLMALLDQVRFSGQNLDRSEDASVDVTDSRMQTGLVLPEENGQFYRAAATFALDVRKS